MTIFDIPEISYSRFSIFLALETTSILRVLAMALIKPVGRGGAGRQTFN